MPTTISIITAIHNGWAVNQLFIESLKKYTFYPYELIIIDNASSDGSAALFAANGAQVIHNTANYSYPYCQNQGISVAKGEYLFFLNNDLVVSPHWDKHLITISQAQNIDVLSACGIEALQDTQATKKIQRRWKKIKNILLFLFGHKLWNLRLMLRFMYGDWENFCASRLQQHGTATQKGIVGNNVLMTRKALALLGTWDERIQGADFDLFLRAEQRHKEVGDIQPCHVAMGVFIHHFIRMTLKRAKYKPNFADANRLISLEDKWPDYKN